MRTSLLARVVAGTAITALAVVGLVAPAASATTSTTRVVSGHVFLGDSSRSAAAGEVTVTAKTIGANSVSASAKTDADGDYSLKLTTADARVRVSLTFAYNGADGFRDGAYPNLSTTGAVRTIELTANDRPGTNITLARPLSSSSPDRHLSPTKRGTDASTPNDATPLLDGRVVDSAQAPVADVAVTLTSYPANSETPDGTQQTTTDSLGAYSFSGLDATHTYTVEYAKDGYAAQTYPDSGLFYVPEFITIDSDHVTLSDAVLYRPATVSGTITFGGLPVRPFGDSDVYVDVMLFDGLSNQWVYTGYGSVVAGNGTYAITGLPPDDYRFQITSYDARGLSSVRTATLQLLEGMTVTVAPRLRPYFRDVTGDRESDLMARNTAGQLVAYQGLGTGAFVAPFVRGSGWGSMTAVFNAGDFNGDGNADVIARNAAGDLLLYKGNGSGGWLGGGVKIGAGWKGFTSIFSPGDFNGDGKTDVVARNTAGDLLLYKGNGAGGWSGAAVKIGAGWNGFTAILPVGDLNEDSYLDVLARDSAGALWLYPGNGSGGWKTRVKVGAGWNGMTAILGLGDVDGDWHPDVIARDASGYLWIYPGSGSGGFGAKRKIGTGWKSMNIVG